MKNSDLLKAKIELYRLLLKREIDQMTDNDVQIMHLLSADPDIQQIFTAAMWRF